MPFPGRDHARGPAAHLPLVVVLLVCTTSTGPYDRSLSHGHAVEHDGARAEACPWPTVVGRSVQSPVPWIRPSSVVARGRRSLTNRTPWPRTLVAERHALAQKAWLWIWQMRAYPHASLGRSTLFPRSGSLPDPAARFFLTFAVSTKPVPIYHLFCLVVPFLRFVGVGPQGVDRGTTADPLGPPLELVLAQAREERQRQGLRAVASATGKRPVVATQVGYVPRRCAPGGGSAACDARRPRWAARPSESVRPRIRATPAPSPRRGSRDRGRRPGTPFTWRRVRRASASMLRGARAAQSHQRLPVSSRAV